MDLPRPPDDHEIKNIIDKLALFVARNGPEFEQMTKNKQEGNPKFSFLFGGKYYDYYGYKVSIEQQLLRSKGPQGYEGPSGGGWGSPGPGWGPPGPGGPPRPLMGKWGPPGPSQGGPWGGSPGPRGPMRPNSPHYGGGPGGGFGPGPGFGGPPELSNRGRSLLGAPPGMEQSPPPPAPTPPPPSTHHLEVQAAELRESIKTLQEQIVQSETNLTAQWTVLQQNQKSQVDEAIMKASKLRLEEFSRSCSINLSYFDSLLQPIMDTCTKDSISTGKQWMFQKGVDETSNQLLSEHLTWRVSSPDTTFNQKLHLIYLVNDVLHHCVRKNNSSLQAALVAVAVPMYCSAAQVAGAEEMEKLSKLITLWQSKNKFFSDQTLEAMKNPGSSLLKYKADQAEQFRTAVEEVERTISSTFSNYKQQHEQYVNHASKSIDQQQKQLDSVQQQVKEIREKFGGGHSLGDRGTAGGSNSASSGRKSRWDRTAAPGAPGAGLPIPDLSRPPPGFMLGKVEQERPSAPYFDLPAGLMVPLVKMEDSGYRALDPDSIRLPPPQPSSDRLLKVVDLFYSGPSHDTPRDTEGWERLGLYEWSRDKQSAIKKKQEDIQAGIRKKSPSPDNSLSRDSSPEQEQKVPERKEIRKEEKKRYRSRSRTRSRSGSRGSTPPRSRDRRVKEKRQRSRSRSRSRERRDRERTRSRSDERRRRRSRSGSSESYSALPSHLTRRSPTPPSRAWPAPGTGSPGHLDQSNKGHQMLQRMGWRGAGLGAGEGGMVEPVKGGEVRDKGEYRGMGVGSDPFESFRKQRAGAFYTRMRDKAEERKKNDNEGTEGNEYGEYGGATDY